MSPKCEVPLLNEISLTVAAKQIIDVLCRLHAEEDLSLSFVVLSSYLESLGLTGDIYQDLLNLILNSDYMDSARFFAIKLLLRENVKAMTTGIFPAQYHNKILETILLQGTGLHTLNVSGIWVSDEQIHYICNIIKTLKNLNVLTIPDIANDEILRCVGEFSQNLKLLDVSGQTDITEVGIYAICNGNYIVKESLTVINIGLYGEENICHTDVALLLQYLPNLLNLGCYSFVGKSIQHLMDTIEKPENLKLKLEYIHDICTNVETMTSIVKTCPAVETIYLQQPDPGVIAHIEKLEAIKKIKLYKFACHEFRKLIERIGHKFNSILLCQGADSLNLTHMAEKCTRLEELTCYEMSDLTHEEEIRFESLKQIKILLTDLRTSTFKYLMTCCPQLNKITIENALKMTDSDMTRLLRSTELKHLESVWFQNAPLLTQETVETMMSCCPKLQSIGLLSGWAVTPDDMFLLKAIIDSTNTALDLQPREIFGVA